PQDPPRTRSTADSAGSPDDFTAPRFELD
ncbi:MAG: hypothetical protein RLZZ436_3954, partial [Planctomycetota bacterium]